jgi:hypothetical protein
MADERVTELEVHRAAPLVGDVNGPSLVIRAEVPMPAAPTLREQDLVHEREGRQIATALWEHLPGGVVDQILCALLERRASQLRVRF